jgi:hypothetical protein
MAISVMVLPIIIAADVVLRLVPGSLRQASAAMNLAVAHRVARRTAHRDRVGDGGHPRNARPSARRRRSFSPPASPPT